MTTLVPIMIRKIINRYHDARRYILADPNDNSISFSKHLFRYIQRHEDGIAPKAYVFRIPENGNYAFVISPDTGQQLWPMNDIQANDQHHTIGFESLCPTVNKIFYDYGLPLAPCKLTVRILKSTTSAYHTIYVIQPPHEESR